MMPARKIPSKVPAPPMEATGAQPPHFAQVRQVRSGQRA